VLSPAEARARILAALADVAPLPPERVPLAGALGRALADDLVAELDLPSFDASTMDGYALRAADAPRAGTRLPVAFEVFAGAPASGPLPPGSCCRIYTGAPLPEGADAVEQQEEVRRAGRAAILRRAAERGRFVRRRGSDVAAGRVAVPAGSVLDPGTVALAAGLGRAELLVRRRPRLVILPTGDEVVPVGRAPRPGQIVETNGHALAAAAREAGAEPLLLPAARGDARALGRALEAARGADALVTTGGVSVGARDLVRGALSKAGARLDFWRVAMRPGKPFTFGRWGDTAVFGLPGNPVSALVTFELFVRPALRALAGLGGTGRLRTRARLAAAQEKPRELEVYLRASLRSVRGELVALPFRSQSSGDLSSAAGVDALAVLPAGRSRVPQGAHVEAIVLRPPHDS
jgi:molybdopterin molybdotransferase